MAVQVPPVCLGSSEHAFLGDSAPLHRPGHGAGHTGPLTLHNLSAPHTTFLTSHHLTPPLTISHHLSPPHTTSHHLTPPSPPAGTVHYCHRILTTLSMWICPIDTTAALSVPMGRQAMVCRAGSELGPIPLSLGNSATEWRPFLMWNIAFSSLSGACLKKPGVSFNT